MGLTVVSSLSRSYTPLNRPTLPEVATNDPEPVHTFRELKTGDPIVTPLITSTQLLDNPPLPNTVLTTTPSRLNPVVVLTALLNTPPLVVILLNVVVNLAIVLASELTFSTVLFVVPLTLPND